MYYSKDLNEVAKKYGIKSDLSNYGAFVDNTPWKPFKNYIVAFSCTYDNSLIAHECVHLVNRLFLDIGMKLNLKNDEAQAYLTGYFFEKIEVFLNKHK